MTIKGFFLITFISGLSLFALRYFYFNESLGGGETGYYIYYGLVAFVSLVLCRRLGTITFLEAAFVAFFWLVVFLFLDLLITSAILGTAIFRSSEFWVGHLIMCGVVFLLHKKRYIETRKKMHAHH
jgi:hypothetical protein